MRARRAHRPGQRGPRVLAHDDSGAMFRDGSTWPRRATRCGRPSCARAAPTPRSRAPWASGSPPSTPRPRATRRSPPEFATDASFHAIRLEPYLLAAARRHAGACAPHSKALAARTAATREALVHGDISPKNILVGPQGPVFLDAECAWYGDPAFDLAFCLNHLLLKCLWVPEASARFLACFDALGAAYFGRHGGDALERRAASLLPGLLLARVDGKSPVEYLTEEAQKDRVRRVARGLLLAPPARLAQVRAAWLES